MDMSVTCVNKPKITEQRYIEVDYEENKLFLVSMDTIFISSYLIMLLNLISLS